MSSAAQISKGSQTRAESRILRFPRQPHLANLDSTDSLSFLEQRGEFHQHWQLWPVHMEVLAQAV